VKDELSIEGRYQVVFTGIPVAGANLVKVKNNFRKHFQLSEENLGKLFSGQNRALQKDVSWEEAIRYRDRMKELGAVCDVLPMEAPETATEPTETFPCPKCRTVTSGDRCSNCNFDIANYRRQMQVKGYVELPRSSYIKERRKGERRSGEDRRDGIRFEDGRRSGRDRRKYKTGWDEIFT
jgi:hypothetical protein